MLNKLYVVFVQKVSHTLLVSRQLAPACQRHSAHKNECKDRVYLFAQYIVINIITDVVKCNVYIDLIVAYATFIHRCL
jgi:hypothetical protein